LLSNIKIKDLTMEQAKPILSLEKTRLVFVLEGKELYWIANNAKFDFWADFSNGCIDSVAINFHWQVTDYLISLWKAYDGFSIVLVELF
jgi:hypothetical protein